MFSLLLFSACFNNTINTEKVVESAPTINLLSPEDGDQFAETSAIGFSAMVRDDIDPPSDLQISWSSSVDGEFNTDPADGQGTIEFEYDGLSAGEHQITFQATNSTGVSTSSIVNIVIVSATENPSIELLLPVDDFVEENTPTLFKVRAVDPNYALEELTLSFSSDLDGEFCTPVLENTEEAYCDEVLLSVGEHSLEFSVTNPNQLSESISLGFSVLNPLQVDNDGDGFTEDDGDCNDEDPLVSPNGTETVNDIDDDCNGLVDDGTDFYDDDGDGYSEDDGDCDDTNEQVFPGTTEICTGLDNDCNGLIDDGTECYDDDQDGFSENDGDCDDDDFNIYPFAPEDVDGIDNNCDGYIDEGSEFFDDDSDCFCESSPCYGSFNASCTNLDEGDCDDTDGAIGPDAPEYCDGIDTNCNNIEDDNPTNAPGYYPDLDGDGYGDPLGLINSCDPVPDYVLNGNDCDDTEPLAWTGNTETCDGIDNDCNGLVDDSVLTTYYADADSDGYGDANNSQDACTQPSGYVTNSNDCNDSEPLAWTGNTEVCDNVDNDCNGTTDDNLSTRFYADLDSDTHGDPNNYLDMCNQPSGYVTNSNDCNDSEPLAWTGNTETCDGVDNDCNGTTDDNLLTRYYLDLDADTYGNPSAYQDSCTQPSGYVTNSGDCDDTEPLAWTSNTESCDGIDNDCDGTIDNGLLIRFYGDNDGDGYGNPSNYQDSCTQPSGFVNNSNDCDDFQPLAWTGNTETCDYVDNDCDGTIDNGLLTTYYADSDGDGYGNPSNSADFCSLVAGYVSNSNDCDDTEPEAWTNNTESCDGIDNDCDGTTDENVQGTYYADADGDGHGDANNTTLACSVPNGYVSNANDCNDSEALAWIGASESCDNVDNNCNGQTDEGVQNTYYYDNDGDGYGDANNTTLACSVPNGYVTNTDDCNDSQPLAWSGASEYCDNIDNNCNGTTDELGAVDCTLYHVDGDSDGYGDPSYYQCQCVADSTYVTTDANDCYDANAQANPAQVSYFTTDRGDGSYDYNCDGAQSQEFTGSGSCDWGDWCNLGDSGWNGTIPACGATGTYMSSDSHCDYACLGFCCDEGGYAATQSCR